jgi:hypothetical protein
VDFNDSLPQGDASTGFTTLLDTAYIPALGVHTGHWDTWGRGENKGPISAAAELGSAELNFDLKNMYVYTQQKI